MIFDIGILPVPSSPFINTGSSIKAIALTKAFILSIYLPLPTKPKLLESFLPLSLSVICILFLRRACAMARAMWFASIVNPLISSYVYFLRSTVWMLIAPIKSFLVPNGTDSNDDKRSSWTSEKNFTLGSVCTCSSAAGSLYLTTHPVIPSSNRILIFFIALLSKPTAASNIRLLETESSKNIEQASAFISSLTSLTTIDKILLMSSSRWKSWVTLFITSNFLSFSILSSRSSTILIFSFSKKSKNVFILIEITLLR